ncbi:hypothetical protein [Microbacterium sp. NIBRBAC000506063]|uniref:hypothetical protein n=1 Tax=Microbacterium sp. NIBRBAC000506063 TaxID=2734618 RepID=UPI001BB5B4AA|nr:hypothetical protein [Microbacterium sp. NIBRBAC000506063]QTV79308.1 hypothetical protein KAE78_09850 [Microbacterium sp. NIBRBAC000506063]
MILPDELLRQAKEAARAADQTFTSVLEEALRRELARRLETRHEPFVLVPFSPSPGREGTLPGVDVTNKEQIHDILDEDDFAVQQIRASERAAS